MPRSPAALRWDGPELGFTVRAPPGPVATALVVGCALLALGRRRERHPPAGFGARRADLR